jgi:D-arginine dehydrogenase
MSVESFDILVIGAGIAGASVAAELATTHRVALLEREELPGYHATGRSAALFSKIYGNATVRALSRASADFFYRPPDGFAPEPLVRPRGSLHIASKDQLPQLEAFARSPDLAAGPVRRIGPAEALRICPVLRPERVHAALIEDDAADVDVHGLHQAYLRRFRRAGGTLVTHADVLSLDSSGRRWTAVTRAGVFAAATVVNAAGAWADEVAALAGALPLSIQPCRRTVVLAELPPAIVAERWPMVIDIDENFYMKPDAGLLLVSPADETASSPCDAQPEEYDVAVAIDRAERATTLSLNRIRKRWAGLRSFAPDRSPVAGFDPAREGFFWLAGQGGYGIQTAPAMARLAAGILRGDTIDSAVAPLVAELSPQRFVIEAATRSVL